MTLHKANNSVQNRRFATSFTKVLLILLNNVAKNLYLIELLEDNFILAKIFFSAIRCLYSCSHITLVVDSVVDRPVSSFLFRTSKKQLSFNLANIKYPVFRHRQDIRFLLSSVHIRRKYWIRKNL